MTSGRNGPILEQFDACAATYRLLAERMSQLLHELLTEHKIPVHSISSRLKERLSLEKKLDRPDTSYRRLQDVTDVAGVRIITYFEDDVDRIAQLIDAEFDVDQANSIDKRITLDPERFGYRSLHHVVFMGAARTQLLEYRRFRGLAVEIQTRSILQHAWAEMEHDLGYKGKIEVPRDVRRRFSRLSGLLELADEEFKNIRDDLKRYEQEISHQIATAPDAVELDRASLDAFIRDSRIVSGVDADIAADMESFVDDAAETSGLIGLMLPRLALLGVNSIGQIVSMLEKRRQVVADFASRWLTSDPEIGITPGMSIFYLCYVVAAEDGDDKLMAFTEAIWDRSDLEEADRADAIAQSIRETYDAVKSAK